MYGGAAGGAAAAAAAIANAVKASGVVVKVGARDFARLLERQEAPLVVHSHEGFLGKKHRYLSSYKGLAFHCVSEERVDLPAGTEVVEAAKIWIPG